MAVDAGVRRLVLLSARQWGELGWREGLAREEAVRDSGTGWTILRPVWFAQNFHEAPFLAEGIAAGEVVHGTGAGRHPFIDVEDIASVAVAALTDEAHHGRHYELTGPEALSIPEAVDLIAAAIGRPISTRALEPGPYREHLLARGHDGEAGDLASGLFDLIRSGRDARLSRGVQEALGREPRDFATYVRRAASAGAWRT